MCLLSGCMHACPHLHRRSQQQHELKQPRKRCNLTECRILDGSLCIDRPSADKHGGWRSIDGSRTCETGDARLRGWACIRHMQRLRADVSLTCWAWPHLPVEIVLIGLPEEDGEDQS